MVLLLSEKVADATERVAERWESVFSIPSGFMVSSSIRRTGVSKTGKSWSSFREEEVKFFSMRSGKLRMYRKVRVQPRNVAGRVMGRSRMGSLRDSTADELDRAVPTWPTSSFYTIGAQSLGFSSYTELLEKEFPLFTDFQSRMPGVAPLTRHESIADMSKAILGKRYQRGVPRILGAVEGNDSRGIRSGHVQTLMVFQGIVPTDWIIDILAASRYRHGLQLFANRDELRSLRRFLRTASPTQLRRLTRNPPGDFSQLLRDTHRRAETMEGVDFRDIQDLHDKIDPYAGRYFNTTRTYTPPTPKPIEYSGKAAKFVGEGDGFSIVAPEATDTLIEWSSYMSNCISGYGQYAAKGATLLYAAMQDDKMVANLELDPKTGSIKQLLGRFNQSLDTELSTAIKSRVLSVWPSANTNNGWE